MSQKLWELRRFVPGCRWPDSRLTSGTGLENLLQAFFFRVRRQPLTAMHTRMTVP